MKREKEKTKKIDGKIIKICRKSSKRKMDHFCRLLIEV